VAETRRSYDVGLLAGGISTQPDTRRFLDQTVSADNVLFDMRDGANKRCGSTLIKVLTNAFETAQGIRLHPIDRDPTEQYVVAYGDTWQALRVFHVDGTEATVTWTADAKAYYDSGSPTPEQIRMVTTVDRTLIVNTQVAVSTSTAADYKVDDTWDNYDVMASQYGNSSYAGEYHRTLSDTAVHTAGYWQYTLATADNGFAHFATRDLRENWRGPRGKWDEPSINDMGFSIRFQRQAIAIDDAAWTQSSKTLTKANAFDDYAFEAGDEIYVTAGTNWTAGYYAIASKSDASNIVLTGSGRSAADNSVISTPGTDETDVDTQGITQWFDTGAIDFSSGANAIDGATTMYEVALVLQEALRNDGADSLCLGYVEDGVGGYNYGGFVIVSPWRGTGTKVIGTYDSDDSVTTDLSSSGKTFEFSEGTAVDGTGSPSTLTYDLDDRWERIAAPGQSTATIDQTKMPIKLERTAAGPPATFEVDVINWSDRITGDENSNPVPRIWQDGRKISDIVTHADRLWLAADEWLVSSQAGDYYNFYVADSDNPTDADPIEVSLGTNSVTLINYIEPFQSSILAFTKAGVQAALTTRDYFAPNRVTFRVTTEQDMFEVRPATMGETVYFCGPKGDAGVLYEHGYQPERDDSYAISVSDHYDNLPTTVYSISTCPDTQVVIIVAEHGQAMHVYRRAMRGGERVQSAWQKWTMDRTCRIADVTTIGDDVYMLIEHAGAGNQWLGDQIDSVPTSQQSGLSEASGPPSGGSSSSGSSSAGSSSAGSSSAGSSSAGSSSAGSSSAGSSSAGSSSAGSSSAGSSSASSSGGPYTPDDPGTYTLQKLVILDDGVVETEAT
jgi:hypothetical protein